MAATPVEPGTVWTEEEREMMETFHLQPEQMMWRRWCIKTKCGRDVNIFREEYPTTAEEAFLLSGTPFFDNMALSMLLRKLTPPMKRGTRCSMPRATSRCNSAWLSSM